MRAQAYSETPFDPNGIVVGGFDHHAEPETLLTGANYAAGTVLGKITASGKYTTSLTASSDGSETPVAVLLEDVDASSGDAPGVVLKQGGVDETKLTFGTGHTAASTRDALAARGLFLK